MPTKAPPTCSDNQVNELLQLAYRLVDQFDRIMIFKREVSRPDNGAPWFVWVAYGHDQGVLGRSGEFRFTSGYLSGEVAPEDVAKTLKREGCMAA